MPLAFGYITEGGDLETAALSWKFWGHTPIHVPPSSKTERQSSCSQEAKLTSANQPDGAGAPCTRQWRPQQLTGQRWSWGQGRALLPAGKIEATGGGRPSTEVETMVVVIGRQRWGQVISGSKRWGIRVWGGAQWLCPWRTGADLELNNSSERNDLESGELRTRNRETQASKQDPVVRLWGETSGHGQGGRLSASAPPVIPRMNTLALRSTVIRAKTKYLPPQPETSHHLI